MQLKNIGSNYPIVLAAGLSLINTDKGFMYEDVSQSQLSSVIQDKDTSCYRDKIESNSYDKFTTNIQFNDYLKNWVNNTMFMSSVNEIINEKNFQSIVAMKEKAVPFIIRELSVKPSTLVWALNLIFDRKISDKKNLTIKEASKLWVNFLTK